jgi:hypothetical protein
MNYNNFVKIICFISFIVIAVFILVSETAYIASELITDDSFYYLQSAWLFKQHGYFTFDGINLTYGFQPLWMLACTVLRYISPDKVFFMKSVLLFSSILYCLVGYLLFVLSSYFLKGVFKIIPSVIWLFNANFVFIFISGKENILALLILAVVLIFLFKYNLKPQMLTIIKMGLLTGLLVLTRINTIIFAVLILFYLLYETRGMLNKFKTSIIFLVFAMIIVLPWCFYANSQFGTIFPNSGTVKLQGSFAALFLFFQKNIPWINIDWAKNLLPLKEQILLKMSDRLSLPSLSQALNFAFGTLPSVSLSFGLFELLKNLPAAMKELIKLTYYILFSVGSISLVILFLMNIKKLLPVVRDFKKYAINILPVIILFISAALNLLINALLMPRWMVYSKWYAFQEILSVVFIAVFILFVVYFLFKDKIINRKRSVTGVKIIALLFVIVLFCLQLFPKKFAEKEQFGNEAWIAKEWINKNLKDSVKIASWSSGLLGYFAQKDTIINLDGLANSLSFSNEIVFGYTLFQNGLSTYNQLWEYIKKNKVKYISEIWFENQKNEKYFHWTIPVENYSIVYMGNKSVDWNESPGKRKYMIIKLNY